MKAWYLSYPYDEFPIPEHINASLSKYYRDNKNSFDKLVEVTLIGCTKKNAKKGSRP